MPRRPTPKSLESLHVTLQKLEQTGDPGKDDASISELKRVVLNRIADLELSKTLVSGDDEAEPHPDPTDLVPPPPKPDEGESAEALDKAELEKLD